MLKIGLIIFLSWSTFNIMQSQIFALPRAMLERYFKWGYDLITCPTCSGFWLGIAFTLIIDRHLLHNNTAINCALMGIIASGGSAFLEAIYGKFKG